MEEFLVGGVRAVEGGVYIDNNSVGCNSLEDIQTSFIGHIIVVTQAEVNALRVNLLKKTIINGNLTIGDVEGSTSSQSDITDLTPLGNITHITGNLIVSQNEQLVHLTGLHHLETLGGYFIINFNDQLITLGDFPSLTSVGIGSSFVSSLNERRNDVSILVENNPMLSNCCALESFFDGENNKTEGEIYIMNNSTGCDNTTEVDSCNLIPPVVISLTKASVSENDSVGTAVGVFSITGRDDDTLDVSTYVYELGGDAVGLFILFGDTLKTAKVFDFETEKSYAITLMTRHPDERKVYDFTFTVMIENVNEPPTSVSLTNVSVSENVPSGTVVGQLSTVDDDIKNDVGDASDIHTYTLGGVEGGLFSIQGDNELVTSRSFDFEAKQSYEIVITTRDGGGLVWTQSFTILITNANDAPTGITLSNDTINENSAVGTVIGGLITMDPDDPGHNNMYIYTIKGILSDIFQIVGTELQVRIPLDYETTPRQTLTIITDDGKGGIFEKDFEITILNVNDAPTGIDITNNQLPENASVGTLVGILTTMDDDDTVHTYELGGDAAGLFTLFGDTLKTEREFNFEERSLYTIQVTTRDADTSFTQDLAIDITDENDAPTFVNLSRHTIAENAEPGVVGLLTASDEDADDEHLYFLPGAVVPFSISGNRLFATKRLNYEEQSSYEIFIKAIDQDDAESNIISFIINITNVNEPPTALSLTNVSVSENEPSGTVVGRLTTTDDDLKNDDENANDLHTYTLGGVDSGFFSITDSYELVTSTSFDFEVKSSYKIDITSRDVGGLMWTQTFTILITDSNDAPTDILLSNHVIAENSDVGTFIGGLSTMDPDDTDDNGMYIYDIGGTASDTFQIMGDELQSKIPLNYETNSRPVITIISDDGLGGIFEKDFTLKVTNVNDAPTAITLSNNTINENEETGTVIGILNSMDEDDPLMNGTYTYTLETTYEDVFQIVGDTLKTKISLNYEENPNYTIQITTNDGNNGIYSGDLIIRILNINDSPTAITLSNDTINENTSIGTTVGTLQTMDEDENENHHYVLSGVDSSSFRIAGNNRLETNDLFDYETKTNYELTLTTTDNGGSRLTQSFAVTINNVNEKLTNIILDNNTITENSVEGTVIGTLSTLDPDDIDHNDTYNYSIEGTASDTFQIVGNELQVKISPNYEIQSSYTIDITTRDQGDNTLTEDFIITIENTNDAPREIILSNGEIPENVKADTLLGILTSRDDDDPFMRNTYTYTLDTMYQDIFEIIGDEFRVKESLNYEEQSTYRVNVSTRDEEGGIYDTTFVISVKDEDDVPTLIRLTKDSVLENQPIGTMVGIFETMDEDEDETYVYTLDTLYDHNSFRIDNDTLKIEKTLNFEEQENYEISITSKDDKNRILTKIFVIHIVDEDDAPHAIILSPDNRIEEKSGEGTVVGKFITLDEDGPEMKNGYVYRLVGENANVFKITTQGNVSELITDSVFVHDSVTLENNSYRISIRVEDFTNRTEFLDTLDIEVTEENLNPPTGITLSGTTVAENAAMGTTIGALTTVDDAGDKHRYKVLGSLSDQFQIVEKRNDNRTFTFELQTSVELNYEEQSTYEIKISTDDGGDGGIYDTTFVISVQDRNDAPTGIQVFNAMDEPVTSVPEKSSDNTLIGTLRAVDEDKENNHSYRLENRNVVPFSIQNNILRTTEEFDFESEKSYTITVEVTDNNNGSNNRSFPLVITVEDVNETPTNITLSNHTIAENKRVGTVIGTLSTEDVDSMDSHTYQLSGEHANFFRIDGKELKTKKVFNYETDNSNYEISITTKDQGERTFTADFTITLVDANDAPTLITLTKDSVAENQSGAIGMLSSMDEDDEGMNNEYMYSSDNGLFEISGDTLKTSSRLDYEEFPIRRVTITTDDGRGGVFSQPFLIKVTNENDPPTDIELNADSIEENIEGRVVIGTVRTEDEDIHDEHVYTVSNVGNNRKPITFSFAGNKLITDTSFNYEMQDSYEISITSDDGSNTFSKTFLIYVKDVNDAPSAIQLTNTSVAENDSIGTLVGILSTIDEDLLGGNPRGDTHLYTLVNDNDSDSEFFRISGDRLAIDTTFNYETQSSYDLVLVTTDRDGASLQQSFTITIEDVNDVPTSLSLSNDVVKENETPHTVIGILSTTDEDDPNMDSVYTYSVNNDIFTIDNDTLKTNRELDFETQSEYLVSITTVDGRGGTHPQDFTLKVSNVNEPPTAIQLTDTSIAENNPSDTLIGILSTTDEDLLNNNQSNDTHSYTLGEDTDKNIFTIQADTLKSNVKFNYEQQANYPISILVTDKEGSTHIEKFTMAIQDRNDAPLDISLSKNIVTENENTGTVIGILSTDDEDDPSMDSVYTYSVNNDTFNIAHDTLKTNRILDFESQPNYDIGITVEDGEGGTFPKTFTIDIHNIRHESGNTDDFNPPTNILFELLNTLTLDLKTGDHIARLSAIDLDFNDSHTFSIDGETKDFFKVVGDTMGDTIKLAKSIDQGMYTVYTHQLIITATDEDGKTYSKNFELTFSTKETSVEIGMFDNSSNGLAKLSKDGDHLVRTTSSRGVAVYEWRDNVWEKMGADIDVILNRNFNRNFFNQSNQLTPFDLSSDGTRIVLGTLDAIGDTKGSTKVFEWDGNVWTPIGDTLTGKMNDYLGENVAMTHDGHRIVIGYTGNEGYVQVFEWEEENWKQVGGDIKKEAKDYFGMAVAISSSGDRILVGDPSKDGQGEVHVYDYDSMRGSWDLKATLTGAPSGDDYGVTLSLSSEGNYFAVGTGKARNDTGRVDIYAWNDPQWEKAITLNGADTEQLGHDVDFSKEGNRLVIGAPRYNDFAGRTIVYEKVHDSLWTEKMTVFAGDIRSNESQGSLVSISDEGHRVMTSGRFNQSLKVFDIDTTNILPSGLELSESFIEENVDTNVYIGTFTTMDDDDDTHTYTISGKNARSFVIKNDSLLTFEVFDYERKNTYNITVQTEDPKGGKLIRDFVININNINEAPTAILLDDSIAVENDGIGTKIGTLNTIDPDINDIHTYTILSDTFQIVGNELQIKIPLDYETKASYLISITTQDQGDSTRTQSFTILVANEQEGGDSEDNHPPTDLTYVLLQPLITSLRPNTSLARLEAIDEDARENHRFTINGKTKDFFKIENHLLKLVKSIDQGSRTIYDHDIAITVTDKVGQEYTEVITLLFNPDETVKDVEFVNKGIDYADLSENGNHLVTATLRGLSHTIAVYEWDGKLWNQIGSDIVEMVNQNEDFSTTRLPIDISANGNRLVIGTLNDIRDTNGQVKVYERDGVSWNTIGNTINGHSGEQLGESVAITDDGNRIIVGIPGNNIGYAQVFQWNPQQSNTGQDAWVQVGKNIVSDDDAKDSYFGFSVSISSDGERIVVGDYKKEGHELSDAGAIYTYNLIYGQWELTGKLLGRRSEDRYGAIYSLSSDGNRLAVSSTGTVTLYDWEVDEGSWISSTTISETKHKTTVEQLGSDLSLSLSKNGNQLVIGDSRYKASSDRVLLYERNEENNQWNNKQENKPCQCLLESTNTLGSSRTILQHGRVVALSSNGKTVMSLGKKNIEVLFLNAPPKGLMLSHDSIEENVNVGSRIGILTTLDDDLADNHLRESHTYQVNDTTAFKISKDTLQTNMLLSFEEQSTYNITISTTDRGGGKVEKDFVITIGDINEALTALELTNHEIKENAPSDTIIIGYINVTDEDLTTVSGAEDDITDEHTYELKDNHASFILSDDTLKAIQTFNYETKATYEITIITTDLGGNTLLDTFNIKITDEHDPPTAITLNNNTVKENAAIGTAIGTLTTEDEDLINRDNAEKDIIDRHTYTLDEDNNAPFTLSNNTLKTTQTFNFETQANYEVTIITTDPRR